MKKLIAILLLILVASELCHAQQKLTAPDRKNYTLSIDNRQIGKPIERLIGKNNVRFVITRLVLTNNSNDTLKFITMTCSYDVIYRTNNKNISLLGHPCDTNFPTVLAVAPHKTFVIKIPLALTEKQRGVTYKFRLGMYLHKFFYSRDVRDFTSRTVSGILPKGNILWSNEVVISY